MDLVHLRSYAVGEREERDGEREKGEREIEGERERFTLTLPSRIYTITLCNLYIFQISINNFVLLVLVFILKYFLMQYCKRRALF